MPTGPNSLYEPSIFRLHYGRAMDVSPKSGPTFGDSPRSALKGNLRPSVFRVRVLVPYIRASQIKRPTHHERGYRPPPCSGFFPGPERCRGLRVTSTITGYKQIVTTRTNSNMPMSSVR